MNYFNKNRIAIWVIIVLAGDHGVLPIPEYLQEQDIDSRRVQVSTRELNQKLSEKFGNERWISTIINSPLLFSTSISTRFDRSSFVSRLLSLSSRLFILMSSRSNSLKNPSKIPKLALFLINRLIAQSKLTNFFVLLMVYFPACFILHATCN